MALSASKFSDQEFYALKSLLSLYYQSSDIPPLKLNGSNLKKNFSTQELIELFLLLDTIKVKFPLIIENENPFESKFEHGSKLDEDILAGIPKPSYWKTIFSSIGRNALTGLIIGGTIAGVFILLPLFILLCMAAMGKISLFEVIHYTLNVPFPIIGSVLIIAGVVGAGIIAVGALIGAVVGILHGKIQFKEDMKDYSEKCDRIYDRIKGAILLDTESLNNLKRTLVSEADSTVIHEAIQKTIQAAPYIGGSQFLRDNIIDMTMIAAYDGIDSEKIDKIMNNIERFVDCLPVENRENIIYQAIKNMPFFDVDRNIDLYSPKLKNILIRLTCLIENDTLERLILKRENQEQEMDDGPQKFLTTHARLRTRMQNGNPINSEEKEMGIEIEEAIVGIGHYILRDDMIGNPVLADQKYDEPNRDPENNPSIRFQGRTIN